MSFRKNFGIVLVIILSVFPIMPWYLMKPFNLRWISSAASLTSIGQITALVGISAFAITLILSGRFRLFDELFGGLDRLYSIHRILGAISFGLLLIHPLVLAFKYLQISIVSAASFLLPGSDWALNFGIFSLLLMMASIVVTVYAKLKYETLKSFHKVLGAAFFLGTLHAFYIPSDISNDMILRTYILGLSGAAVSIYLYRSVLGRFFIKKYLYKISRVNIINDDITELVMKPQGRAMYYEPGQFVFISVVGAGISNEVHPFSISSSPRENLLKVTIKALGDYTSEIKNLSSGAFVNIEGPFGKFSYLRARRKKQVWIAGGIGITPFLNMARHIKGGESLQHDIDLYYCGNNQGELIFLRELMNIASSFAGFNVIPFYSSERGFLTAGTIEQETGGIYDKDILLCGPPPMMNGLKRQFAQLRIPRKNIYSEEFKLL